ncbi:hypothetical protein NDU88_003094, partial [Pleurodeles waltl]
GTAMGTCFAPSYANLFMGWWEEQVAEEITQLDTNVVLWCCFIDDIFVIWRGDEEAAMQFVRDLNTNKCNLRFTEHLDSRRIEFLDVEISVR